MPPIRLTATSGALSGVGNTNIEASGGGGSGTPNFTALPIMARQMPDVSLFASRRALSAGATFTDPVTGVTIRKLTDATTDPAGTSLNYAEGGPFISQRWGGTNYTVRLGPGVLIDVNPITGISNRRSMPSAADTSFGFSMDPATPRLAYYLNNAARLFAYDTATNANITTTHIPSTGREFAAVTGNAPYLEWLTVVQNGWVTFQSSGASGGNGNRFLVFFNVLTGETVSTTFADNNQLHPSRDGSSAFLASNSEYLTTTRIWRRATNDQITIATPNGGHPAGLTGCWADVNPHGSTLDTVRYDLTGTSANVLTMSAPFSTTGVHHAGQYPQSGLVTAQYFLSDSQGSHRAVAASNTWTLQSGQIYRCTVDWSPSYQKPTIGIQGVFQHTTTPRTMTNTLTRVTSLGAMSEGSFWYDTTEQQVYVWCVGGGSPQNRVALMAAAGNVCGLSFIRADGGDGRLLCHHGNYNWTFAYNDFSFGTWSPNGVAVLFRSAWGLEGGRLDYYMAFAPETT